MRNSGVVTTCTQARRDGHRFRRKKATIQHRIWPSSHSSNIHTAHSTSVLCFQQWRQQVEYVVIHVAAREARWRGLCDQMFHEKDAKNHNVDTNATFCHPHLWIVACWNLGVLLSRLPLALDFSLLHSGSPSTSGRGYHN